MLVFPGLDVPFVVILLGLLIDTFNILSHAKVLQLFFRMTKNLLLNGSFSHQVQNIYILTPDIK